MLQDVQYAALLSRGYFLEYLIIFRNSMPKNHDFHYKKYRVANGNAYFDKNMLLFFKNPPNSPNHYNKVLMSQSFVMIG